MLMNEPSKVDMDLSVWGQRSAMNRSAGRLTSGAGTLNAICGGLAC